MLCRSEASYAIPAEPEMDQRKKMGGATVVITRKEKSISARIKRTYLSTYLPTCYNLTKQC